MKYALLSLLFALCMSVSCKDKSPIEPAKDYCLENPGSCETVMEGKKYFAFGMGSWWVYEEENSGDRDSVYVTEAYNNPDNYDFDIRMYSTYQDYNYHIYPQYINTSWCSLNGESAKKCMFIHRSKGKIGDHVGEDCCFFINFKKGYSRNNSGNIYFVNNKIIVEDIFQTFELGFLNFQKTVKIHELSTRIEGIQPTNHYYSKNVGLIRKELLDSNKVWNLVDYHIEL